MVYQRGVGSVEVELARVQSALEDVVPEVARQGVRIDSLESDRDNARGSLRVIIWLNGIIIGLFVVLIGTLFSWGLSHISIHANLGSGPSTSAVQSPQDSSNSPAYANATK